MSILGAAMNAIRGMSSLVLGTEDGAGNPLRHAHAALKQGRRVTPNSHDLSAGDNRYETSACSEGRGVTGRRDGHCDFMWGYAFRCELRAGHKGNHVARYNDGICGPDYIECAAMREGKE